MSVISKSSPKKRSVAATLALTAWGLFACSENPVDVTDRYVNGLASVSWQEQARTLVAANNVSAVGAARVYAILAVAQYGAIDGVDDRGYADGTLPSRGYAPGGANRFESERGAVAAASAAVLAYFFPSAKAALDLRVQQEAATASPRTQFDRGVMVGTGIGETLINWAKKDHTADAWTGSVPVGDGMWKNNGPPASPMLGKSTAYFLTSGLQFRPPVPPAFGSAAFLADLAEVRTLSAGRTSEQLATAQFWNFAAGTMTSSGYWNQLASGLIEQYRLDERAATHVFALMHAAMFDAGIGCWDAKYFYWLIRPSQVDAAITLPIGLPNHPSYPSGHSCNSAAATTVLASFFPTEAVQLNAKVIDAGLSRMYAGLHYRFDITAGQNLGKSVAQHAISIDQSKGLLSVIQ